MATIAEWVNRIEDKIKQAELNKPLLIAVTTVNALRMRRIFQEGENSAGGSIGTYSTKPMIASKSQFIVESKFKEDKWIKFKKAKKAVPVMEIPGGYKQFRAIQGRESGKVNLRYSNDLQSDMANIKLEKTANKAIPSVLPIKVSVNSYKIVLRDKNILKKQGLEKKYGNVFKHTKEELETYYMVLREEQNKLMANLK